jgi:hypothetical protein
VLSLLLEEYGVTFEYLPGNKYVVVDALSRFDFDSLKIQEEEEVFTLLSGSENNSISNIELTITIHTAMIFKEQAKVKVVNLLKTKLDILVTFSLPEFNLKKQICSSWAYHVDDRMSHHAHMI